MPQSRDPSRYPAEILAFIQRALREGQAVAPMPSQTQATALRHRIYGFLSALDHAGSLPEISIPAKDFELIIRTPRGTAPAQGERQFPCLLIMRPRQAKALQAFLSPEELTEAAATLAGLETKAKPHQGPAQSQSTQNPRPSSAFNLDGLLDKTQPIFEEKTNDKPQDQD